MFKTLILFSFFLLTVAATAADTINGTVTNQTTNKPSAGDEVVLLRLGQGMQEESRTKTDDQGKFTLNVTSPQDAHIIQVSHQGVNYDQPVSSSGQVDIKVYDVVAKIQGLQGPIGLAQVESDGKVLRVTEMYDLVNSSDPPVTQSRADNYVITIPANAVIDSADAKRGTGIWVKTVPDPVKGQKGKYAINFPIRPGDTLFKFVYHMPYQSPATLHIKLPYPIQRFGVMHATSMSFKPLSAKSYKSGLISPGLQGEQAANSPVVDDVPAFQIAGMGTVPEHGNQPQAAAPRPPTVAAPPSSAPHPVQPKPPSAEEQSKKEAWLMVAGIVLIVVVGGFTLWRMRGKKGPAIVSAKPAPGTPLLDALKEELFQLESNRLHGSISQEEYATTKEALSKSIERAMGKH